MTWHNGSIGRLISASVSKEQIEEKSKSHNKTCIRGKWNKITILRWSEEDKREIGRERVSVFDRERKIEVSSAVKHLNMGRKLGLIQAETGRLKEVPSLSQCPQMLLYQLRECKNKRSPRIREQAVFQLTWSCFLLSRQCVSLTICTSPYKKSLLFFLVFLVSPLQVLIGCSKVRSEPSLLQAEQPLFSQSVPTGLVFQPSDHSFTCGIPNLFPKKVCHKNIKPFDFCKGFNE